MESNYAKKICEELHGIRIQLTEVREIVENGAQGLEDIAQGLEKVKASENARRGNKEDLRTVLKNGMVLETQNGSRWIWHEGKAIGPGTYIVIDRNLEDIYGNSELNVTKVFDVGEAWNMDDFLCDVGEMIWMREEETFEPEKSEKKGMKKRLRRIK